MAVYLNLICFHGKDYLIFFIIVFTCLTFKSALIHCVFLFQDSLTPDNSWSCLKLKLLNPHLKRDLRTGGRAAALVTAK